jgi:selenocysteine lyase/cysteine desulfurase
MGRSQFGLSRRGFLGGTATAAIGGVAGGLLPVTARAFGGQSPMPALALDALKPVGPIDEAYWWKVRSQFNVVDGLTFMNNGTLGPMPRVVFEANERYMREIMENPTDGGHAPEIDKVREKVAAFVGATADEIALTRSTTEGMNIFAHGFDWKAGDEVIYCTHEHGGGTGPYKNLEKRVGIKIVNVAIPAPPQSVDQIVGLYEKAITPRTKVIMVSHVTYVTGLVTPVKELTDLAHRRGLLISVDGAHPLGLMDLDLHALGVDHYSAAGQKWLMCGTGTGVCYMKRDVQDRIAELMGAPSTDPKRGARKYEEFGQRDVPDVLGMGAAVDLQMAIGKKNVEARDRALSTRLRAGLKDVPGVKLWTSEDPKLSTALTLFSVRDIPMDAVQKAMMKHDRVWVRTMGTGNLNGCRAATHIYNMPEEVDRLVASVRWVSENAGQVKSTAG